MNSDRLSAATHGDVLLTGATGFLGMELLARYLERTNRTVLALVRASDHESARARIGHVLRLLFGRADAHPGRVIAIPGDIERDKLGLTGTDEDLLVARAGEIVHCAATVSFVTGLADSRRINVEGTRNVLRLAERCARRGPLQRLAHVSTAYVAGTHKGLFGEDQLDVAQGFRNGYERSKYEAERLVRMHASLLPAITILRPSIIVGESSSGWTPAFNVLYVPMRAFAQRQMRVLPATPSAPVDVVPADHVADAIIELTRADDQGLHTYHLVAGEHASTVGQLMDLSARYLRRRPPPLVPPRLYRAAYPLLLTCAGKRRRALKRAGPFLPYYTMRVRFGRDRAARRLDPVGLQPPPLPDFHQTLLDYAVRTHWGRRPISRRDATPGSREPR
jgi:thioester reductase-like protein